MATTSMTGLKSWEELVDWYQRFPFGDAEPYAAKITKETRYFMSWGPDADGLHRTPNPIYFSTRCLTTGVFSLAPGDYFKPGNHPNPETYYILSGTLWLGNADTGQLQQLEPGDALIIPQFQFHLGHNFGDKTVEILFMIARETHTEQMRAHPQYDDHYQNFRTPITLHLDADHRHQQHDSFAQPAYRNGQAPRSRLEDLQCWPRVNSEERSDIDNIQIVDRRDYLHLVTGRDYGHQFLTSFFYSTSEFQSGKIRIPPGRVTDAIRVKGERVYYPISETPLVVILSESGKSLIGGKEDGIFVPANTVHQFQNPGDRSAEAVFVSATRKGITY